MSDERKVIPVVFSTNDKYVHYCYLAISSLLKHADKNNYYDIRVFMTSLSPENIRFLEELTNEYASVACMNVLPYVENEDLRELSFFTVEAFYRLFISQILREYQKVLYLDSDMLVLRDITPLYDTQMNGHPIAAVHDVVCSYLAGHAKELGLEMENMFNSGVLVIDTQAYERQNIRKSGLEALSADYRNERRKFIYVDQDVLNTAAYNNVEFIDDRWNFQWEFTWRLDSLYDGYRGKYEQASKDPWIIHYAGDKKPGSYPFLPLADYFWDMVLETGIIKKVVENSIRIERENKERLSCFQGFRFPYERVKPGSRVAVYGAGNVGQDFVKQLCNTLYARLAIWADMRYQEKPEAWNVARPEELALREKEFDSVIIAIDDEKIASQAAKHLKQRGVPEEKLIWQNFRRCDYE